MCAAGSRIYVQEGIYDQFIKMFAMAAESIKHGDQFNPETQQGPLVSETQLKVSAVTRFSVQNWTWTRLILLSCSAS